MARKKYPEAIETGERIRLARINKGLSMEQLGMKLTPPASKGAVSNWENGYNLPNNSRLSQLASILDVSTLFLLTGRKILSDYENLDDGTVIPAHEFVKSSIENGFYESAIVYSDEFLNNYDSFGPGEVFAISKLYDLLFTLQGIELEHPKNYKETTDFIGVLLQNLNYQIEKDPSISLKDFYTTILDQTEYPK